MPRFPSSVDELTPELLTEVLSERTPDVEVRSFEIIQTMQCGDGFASTADRVILGLDFAPGRDGGVPERVMLKTMLLHPHAPQTMYENEVRFYREIRHELPIEAPLAYAGVFDPETGQFGVIMEDLGLRDAVFPNATTPLEVDEVAGLIRTLAALHAQYWQSPRFASDLAWVATPCSGGMYPIFHAFGLELISDQVEKNPLKAELIEQLPHGLPELWEDLWKLQAILENEPTTLLHGDPHIGNAYLLPGAQGGLLDWQLMVRGRWSHDVTYLLMTGLSTEQRRANQRALLRLYLAELRARGVDAVPDEDAAWLLYRQSAMWGLVIGWLITPPQNYGEAITRANLERLVAAVQDLETIAALG
jgi:hypothetical protein